MSQFRGLLIGLICIIVQITLLNLLTIRGVKPDIVLLFVVVRAMKEGPTAGVAWGFGMGLLLDAVSGALTGLGALAYSLTGFICGQIGFGGVMTRARYLMVIAAGAALVYGIMLYFHQPWQTVGWIKPLFTVSLPGAIYTWCLGLIWVLSPFQKDL